MLQIVYELKEMSQVVPSEYLFTLTKATNILTGLERLSHNREGVVTTEIVKAHLGPVHLTDAQKVERVEKLAREWIKDGDSNNQKRDGLTLLAVLAGEEPC